MTLMEQLAAEKKAAQQIVDKGMENITADEQKQLKQHYEQAKSLSERVSLFKSVNSDLDRLGKDDSSSQLTQAKSLGDWYALTLQRKGMSVLDTKNHTFETPEYKAATDTHSAGGGDGAYGPMLADIDQNGVFPFERPLSVADLFGTGTVAGSSIKYPVYGAIEGGAASVAEGGQKPQLHMPDPEWQLDSLSEVAAWWKITDDMAEDLPYIVSEINQHAQYNLQLEEELQLLSGSGTDNHLKGLTNRGIQQAGRDSSNDQDRIFHATTLVSDATGFQADAIVINPADYEKLRLSKDNNGQYFGGGFFAGQYGANGIMQQPQLWGLKTVVTPSVPQGTVIVGAFKAGGMVFRKGGLRVESTNSHEDDFTADKITFRVRERLGLQVKYPKAFVAVTLGQLPPASQSLEPEQTTKTTSTDGGQGSDEDGSDKGKTSKSSK